MRWLPAMGLVERSRLVADTKVDPKGAPSDKDEDDEDIDLDEKDAKDVLDKARGSKGSKKDEEDDEDDLPPGVEHLTDDAGKRALAQLRADRREARQARAAAEKDLADARKKVAEYEGKDKTVQERLQQELDEAKSELTKERSTRQKREAAEEYAPDDADTKLVRAAAKWISGSTDDELKESAEEFYSLFAGRNTKDSPPKGEGLRRKPEERLRGGGHSSSNDDEEDDPRELAKMIKRDRSLIR